MDDPIGDTDQNLQEWSRHYDSLQWAISAIAIAGLGGLISASSVADANLGRLGVVPALAGLILSAVATYWAASFRCFRRRLHLCMSDGLLKCLLLNRPASGLPHQWTVLVAVLGVIDLVFLAIYAQRINLLEEVLHPTGWLSFGAFGVWLWLLLVWAVLSIVLWRRGNSEYYLPRGSLSVEYDESGRQVRIAGDANGLRVLAHLCVALIDSRSRPSVREKELAAMLAVTSLGLAISFQPPPRPLHAPEGRAAQQ